MNFLEESELAKAKPLKTPLTGALVLRITETDFLRLLRTLELEFSTVKIIYKDLTPAQLWIRRAGESQ